MDRCIGKRLEDCEMGGGGDLEDDDEIEIICDYFGLTGRLRVCPEQYFFGRMEARFVAENFQKFKRSCCQFRDKVHSLLVECV